MICHSEERSDEESLLEACLSLRFLLCISSITEIKDFPLCVNSATEIRDFLPHLYLTYLAMLQTFGFPRCFASLHPHVWAFAKVYAQLERARLVVDFGSLLLSYCLP